MKRALIVGINAYPQQPLTGMVNDANDWNSTLLAKGFSNTVLLDATATKANIVGGLTWLCSGAQSGDSLAFCFSGHGSQAADVSGDEPDGVDEVLAPVDYFAGQRILDDELRAVFATLASGVNLDVFLGCCYAGTGSRDGNLRPLRIPSDVKSSSNVSRMTVIVPSMNHCLWAACKDNQLAYEASINGVPRGLFMFYAAKAMRAYPNYTRASLITSIQNAVQKVVPQQQPQLECTQAESLQKPFM